MFDDSERTLVIILSLIAFFFISAWWAKLGASSTAKDIGNVKCNRCGHEGTAKAGTEFKAFKGVQTNLSCQRCGSQDWEAV